MIDYYRMYEGESCLLNIADTAGDEIYLSVTEDEIRKGDAFRRWMI